jgi:hypothetical protein
LPPAGSIRGRVVMQGSSTRPAQVSAIGPGRTRQVRAARDGAYAFDGLPPGEFELVARVGLQKSVPVKVTVAAGRETIAPDVVIEASTTLRVMPARPAPGARFEVFLGEHDLVRGSLSDGRAIVVDVPVGSLRVIVRADGRADEEHAIETSAGQETLLRVLETP